MFKTRNQPVVLMYHGIHLSDKDAPPEREAGAGLYDISVDVFRKQMSLIREKGFFVSTLRGKTHLENQAILVLTFDDGEMNNFTRAWPILKEYHYQAHFFVIVDRVGRKGYMDWDQLKELLDSGMVVGSHGMSHRVLTALSPSEIRRELHDSREILERRLHAAVECVSIPRGFVTPEIIHMAEEAGYRFIFVSRTCPGTSRGIVRTAVKKSWSMAMFEGALYGKASFREKIAAWAKECVCKTFGTGFYLRLRERLVKK